MRRSEVEVEASALRGEGFWPEKTLQQLAVEQAVAPIQRLEEVLGAGAGLWADEHEFHSFLEGIYQRRKEDRAGN